MSEKLRELIAARAKAAQVQRERRDAAFNAEQSKAFRVSAQEAKEYERARHREAAMRARASTHSSPAVAPSSPVQGTDPRLGSAPHAAARVYALSKGRHEVMFGIVLSAVEQSLSEGEIDEHEKMGISADRIAQLAAEARLHEDASKLPRHEDGGWHILIFPDQSVLIFREDAWSDCSGAWYGSSLQEARRTVRAAIQQGISNQSYPDEWST